MRVDDIAATALTGPGQQSSPGLPPRSTAASTSSRRKGPDMYAIHHRYADTGHVADAYHRIDTCGTSKHLVVRHHEQVIADSARVTALSEP